MHLDDLNHELAELEATVKEIRRRLKHSQSRTALSGTRRNLVDLARRVAGTIVVATLAEQERWLPPEP